MQSELGALVDQSDDLVQVSQRRSSSGLHRATLVIAITFLVIIAVTLLISVSQYRSIMRPLRELRDGCDALPPDDLISD